MFGATSGWILQFVEPIPDGAKILVSCAGEVSLVVSADGYVYAEDEAWRISFAAVDAWQHAPTPYEV